MHPPSRYRLHSSLILLTLFALSIPQLHAGTLTPTGDNPIDASVANEDEIADYTFTFVPDTTIPAGGTLTVTFPTQYTFGLGIPLLPTCSVTCSVSGFQVIFTFDSPVLNNVTSNVTIESVQNPATKGGTGNFQLVSQTGDNVLDENLIFGVIGIADTIGLLTSTLVSLDSSGVLNAGEVTKYSFSFKVSQVIPAGSYMKFNISDENFGLSAYPSCAAFSINSKIITGKLVCQTVGREIVITGLSADIPAAQDVGITVSMTNPRYSGLTDGFSIAIYRNGTNAIYDRRTDIAGIPITAGKFSNVALTKVDSTAIQARDKMMDYTLTFLPKNALELGSVIVLVFPTTFVLDTTLSNSEVIQSGLDDISEDVTVGLVVDTSNTITISNFKAIAVPAQITIQVRLTNPDNIGETTPVYIRTYTDSTLATLIDEDITSAVTSVQNYPSPSSHNISIGAVQTTYTIPSLQFFFIPSVSVPVSGIIKVEVPSDFTVATVKTTSCFVLSINTASQTWVQAANCYNIDNLITITLPSANTMPLGSWAGFRVDSVVTTPIYNGTFLFDMTTYKAGGTTPIESWTEPMTASSVPFADAIIDSLCWGIGKTTVLTTTFTTDFVIPAGIKQNTASDTKGFIELVFYNITSANLGATSTSKQSVPCRPAAGLSPLASGAINCTLYPGTIPVIRIDNFQEIEAGTVISFGFPAITNPSINFQVNLKTISFTNRIRTELNSMQIDVNVSTPVALTESGTVGSSAYVFSSNIVSTFSNITLNPGTSTDIVGPGTFIIQMPFYDTGYVTLSNTIGCKLDTTYYPCTRYYQADWITIWLPTGSTFYTGKTITLENIAIPRYANVATSGPLLRFIMSSNHQERVNRPQQYFPSSSVPTFYQADLVADRKSQGAVNAEYTLTFASQNEIPAGASLVITFPGAYSLLVSYPPVRFSSPNLVDISSTQTVTFTPNVQTLTVTNFASVPAQTAFSIVVNGIRNPSTVSSSTGWKAQILLGTYLMVSQSSFDQFTFTPALSPGTITFNSIIALPMNANQYADYTISFVPATEIPIGGQVRITFPSTAYSSLPNPPDCSVSGGITTFARCTLSGNTYYIELDADYSTGGIAVTIKNVTNPGIGTTDGFVVRTYYDSTFLDNTDTTDLTGRTVTIVDEPDILSVKSLSYDPMNEGESATYTFSFLPTNPITTSMEIQFMFPDVYDQLLGETISCATVAGLDGDVSCSVNNRVVTATGFDTYEPDADNPIIISIYGVVNPNQNINTDTGQFKIATLATTSYVFIDYNAAAGAFEMLPAPDWSPLFNISATNLDTRLDADYTFNFTSYDGILSTSSQGAVLIDYPSDFILTSGTLTCVSKTTAFASSSALSCSVANNRVTISGQPSLYTGNVVLVVQDILNPVEEGTAGNIVLKTYDGFNKKILERSYKNLDPFTFAYAYPGPQITVNDNNVIRVERGTQSQDIYITVDFPCALDLVFKPTTPGFSIIPFNVPLSLGDIQAGFRVAVPQSFAEGTYYIEWETMNENDPPYYTPLKKTQVIVTSLTNLRVTVPTLYEIPYGGNSLPSPFTVSYGPDIGFEITLSFAGTSTGILLDRKNVIFRAGDQSSTFTVYASNDSSYASTRVDRGTLNLAITGVNQGVYALASSSIDFLVIDADTVAPDITELSITDITMNTATIIIGSSEICIAYYMIALAGSATPTLDEVMNQGPAPYTTTQSVYGTATIGTENRVEIAITGLVAETPYQVYVYIIDRGGNTNDPRTETFDTLDRYNAATFSLNFKQSFLNSAEIQLIINEVAFVLSLPPAKVQQRKYVITVSSRLLEEEEEAGPKQLTDGARVLGGDSAEIDSTQLATTEDQNPDAKYMLTSSDSTVIYLQIMAIPESAVYPSPLNLALLLNGATRISELNSLLSNYDTTYTVTATEFTRYYPGFPVTPTCSSLSWSWAAITGTLNNYGFIYTVFLKAAEDVGKPSPYQIAQGFNSANIQNSYGSVEVSTAYVDFTVNVTGLDPLTDYNVYVVGASAHPGYPDLDSADSIVIITIKTEAAPVTPHLNINGGSIIEVSYVAVLFAITVLLAALM